MHETFKLDTLLNNTEPIVSGHYRRLTVATAAGSTENVTVGILGNHSFDLPKINDAYHGSKNRWVFATGDNQAGDWWNTLVKLDARDGSVAEEWKKPHHWPTEPVFVPRPGSDAEDDGVLLSIVLRDSGAGVPGASYLLILNATTFETVAEAHSTLIIPYTSHGFFDNLNKLH